jgi:hypothetical protein
MSKAQATDKVQALLDVAEELRKADQLFATRLASAANFDITTLRGAAARARDKQGRYEEEAANPPGWGTFAEENRRRNSGLAAAWRRNADALTEAVGLVLDRQAGSAAPTASPGTVAVQIVVQCTLVVHSASETWRGELQLAAVPTIGSTIRVDDRTTLTVTDVEMNLKGHFTIHTEPRPAGGAPSRAALTKSGLVVRPGTR